LGIPFGLLLLIHCDDRVTRRILAGVIIAFSVYSLGVKQRIHLERDHPVWLAVAGFCSGVLGGAYGMNGPPLAVYGSLRRWSPQHFRCDAARLLSPASLAGLIGLRRAGRWGPRGDALPAPLPPGRHRGDVRRPVAQPPPQWGGILPLRLRCLIVTGILLIAR